jgi:CcmD family protein
MGYVVAAFTAVWLGVFGYLGWITLRLRGARAELAAAMAVMHEREASDERP